MDEPWRDWLKRAHSNLKLAQVKKTDDICYEDLCFEAQQAAEKALKALLACLTRSIPKVHSFHVLLEELEHARPIPKEVKEVLELTDFAVQTRYPGDYTPISEGEYLRAVTIAETVIDWVEKIVAEKS